MTKQAYMRGLTKKAANTDFFTSYDDRWSRAGIAGLATLLGSKALGAGWGTAGTLAALAGTGAYNTHNYDAIKNRVTEWLGLGKKEQTPAPAPKPEQKSTTKPKTPTQSQKQQQQQSWQDMQQQARQDVESYNDPHILGTHSRPAIGPDSRTYIQQYNDQGTPVTGAQITAKQQAQHRQQQQWLKRITAGMLHRIKARLAQQQSVPAAPVQKPSVTPRQSPWASLQWFISPQNVRTIMKGAAK